MRVKEIRLKIYQTCSCFPFGLPSYLSDFVQLCKDIEMENILFIRHHPDVTKKF
jgi:hypothetical protein